MEPLSLKDQILDELKIGFNNSIIEKNQELEHIGRSLTKPLVEAFGTQGANAMADFLIALNRKMELEREMLLDGIAMLIAKRLN